MQNKPVDIGRFSDGESPSMHSCVQTPEPLIFNIMAETKTSIEEIIAEHFERVDSFAELEDPLTSTELIEKLYELSGVLLEKYDLVNNLNVMQVKRQVISNEVFWLLKLKE